MKSEENWKDSIKEGPAFYYYTNGDILRKGEFRNNQKVGCWFGYYPSNRIKSFNEYLLPDSAALSLKPYPNRYLDFLETGGVDLNVATLYFELSLLDTLGAHVACLDVRFVPAETKPRIIYSHSGAESKDTLYEEDIPVLFQLSSDSDYVSGMIQCYTDSIFVNGEWGYKTYEAYFDSRKPTCNVPVVDLYY